MNLIDTYVSEVGRRLPRKARSDIEAEIRSALEDMLEERSQKSGKPVDDEMTFEVLKEYGAPEKVAASYMPERYLIGPSLYPTFLMVLRIIFPVIAILAGLSAIFTVSHTAAYATEVGRMIVSALTGIVTAVISALGNLVLIFALIEWVLRNEGIAIQGRNRPKAKEWDPRSLAKVSAPNQVKIVEAIIEIVGCFAAILLFNFYPQIIGLGSTPGGGWYIGTGNWTVIPLLSEAFFRYVPYLTLVWALTIALNIVLLRLGHWDTVTRIFLIGLKVINILIAACMLAGPSLLAVTAGSLAPVIADAGAAGALVSLLGSIVRVLLWVTILGNGIEIIKAISRLVNDQLPSPSRGKA
jgi:hypothetical protein